MVDDSLRLDMGVINKFGRLNITAPIFKEDLPKTIKDLEELKLAFLQKGDEERDLAKSKFLKESRRARGVPHQETEEESKGSQSTKEEAIKAPSDKLKIVEKIGQMKRRQMA